MHHKTDARNSTATTPDQVGNPSVSPQDFGRADHNFTLQIVMELQKSTGQLTSSVESLKDIIEKQDKKINDLENAVIGVSKKIYAATVVLAILVAIGGFNVPWDLMVK